MLFIFIFLTKNRQNYFHKIMYKIIYNENVFEKNVKSHEKTKNVKNSEKYFSII